MSRSALRTWLPRSSMRGGGPTRAAAAAGPAGMCERSARNWKEGSLPSVSKSPRDWRTRPDPFAEVWKDELVPLLEKDDERILEARTLMGGVGKRHGGGF